MAGPSWLAWAFASVVIIVAGYCLTRLVGLLAAASPE